MYRELPHLRSRLGEQGNALECQIVLREDTNEDMNNVRVKHIP